jgi:hypothetical protein
MEEANNNLNEQYKTILDKISSLETNMITKAELVDQVKALKEEISFLKSQMIKKTDLNITVKNLNGSLVTLSASKTDTINDLKSQYEQKENVPKKEQFFYLDGKLLDDNLTVGESNIKESSVIRLVKEKDEFLSIVPNNNYKNYFVDSLEKNLSKKIKSLLYSARKNGDDANTFHKMCDNKGELLYVIVTTNNAAFAIYVSKPLFSDNQTRNDSLQMIISPSHNFSIKSKNDRATYHCNSGQGAHFHCMEIRAPFLSSNCVDIQSCDNFDLPAYPSGNSSYQIKELEVYALE